MIDKIKETAKLISALTGVIVLAVETWEKIKTDETK